MTLSALPRKDPSVQPRMVKTSIVGFCWGCQSFHYREEAYRDDGDLCCKRTGGILETGGHHPPIPVEVPEEDLEYLTADDKALKEDEEAKGIQRLRSVRTPPLESQIRDGLESIAFMLGVSTDDHEEAMQAMVTQFMEIVEKEKGKPDALDIEEDGKDLCRACSTPLCPECSNCEQCHPGACYVRHC